MNIIQKIKALIAVNTAIEALKKENKMDTTTKPGWKTSEFWMNAATIGLTLLTSIPGVLPPESQTAVIATAVLTAVYTICRTLHKNAVVEPAAKDIASTTTSTVVSTTPSA